MQSSDSDGAEAGTAGFVRAGRRDLYGDVLNEAVFMRPGQQITRAMVVVDDGIDGAVIGAATGLRRGSDALRGLQTGFARSYALSMLAGTALVAGAVLLTNSGKFAHYAPGNTGYAVTYGSLSECVESAIAGRLVREPRSWS